jgi:hypothetical protein
VLLAACLTELPQSSINLPHCALSMLKFQECTFLLMWIWLSLIMFETFVHYINNLMHQLFWRSYGLSASGDIPCRLWNSVPLPPSQDHMPSPNWYWVHKFPSYFFTIHIICSLLHPGLSSCFSSFSDSVIQVYSIAVIHEHIIAPTIHIAVHYSPDRTELLRILPATGIQNYNFHSCWMSPQAPLTI